MTEHIMNFIDYIRTERNYSDHTETNYLIDLEAYEIYIKNRKLNYKEIKYKDITEYIKYLKEKQNLKTTSL